MMFLTDDSLRETGVSISCAILYMRLLFWYRLIWIDAEML